jgi:recombinational DNA repair protein (RecF pathway)
LRNINESFDRMTAGLAICESVLASQTHEEQNLALYTLLKSSLVALNDTTRNEQSLVFWFQTHYAAVLGFALNPSICAASGEVVSAVSADEFVVSLADGAPYSEAFAQIHSGFRMRQGALRALQKFVHIPVEAASTLTLTPQTTNQLADFFSLYYQFHLERNLTDRTRRFMQAVSS